MSASSTVQTALDVVFKTTSPPVPSPVTSFGAKTSSGTKKAWEICREAFVSPLVKVSVAERAAVE